MNDENLKSEITACWDSGSEYYDSHVSHGIKSEEEESLWMKVFSEVITEKSLKVLDVGCGTGAMGLILSKMGHDVSGIDLSEGMMSVGRKKAEEAALTMTFELGDAENPQFEDNTFDVVVNRHLLWTLPHPKTALENWLRVLKPSGILIVIDGKWNDGSVISNIRKKISNSIANRKETHPHGSHTYGDDVISLLPNMGGLSKDDAVKSFEDAGFEIFKTIDLQNIQKCQSKDFVWYQKIAPKSVYYLIAGRKKQS